MSASVTVKVLVTTLFLCLVTNGEGQCYLSDVKVSQSQLRSKIHDKPEWAVTITANCPCSVADVRLNCKGFQTVEDINPSVLNISGDVCLLNNGNPITDDGVKFKYDDGIKFKYAWDHSFPLNPISATIACS